MFSGDEVNNLRITKYEPGMSNPNAPAAAPRALRLLGLAGLLAAAVYFAVYFQPYATAADASGYLNSAKLLSAGKLITRSRVIPELTLSSTFQLVPLGFTCEPKDGSIRLAPTYPVGLPLQFAAASAVAGWAIGPEFVSVGAVLAALAFTYFAARELGVSPLLGLAGAAALAASPVFIFIGIQPLSDVNATAWSVAAVFFALRAARSPARGWALACGAAFAMAVLVRPSNILLAPALALLLFSWRALAWWVVGGVPAAIALLAYQKYLYADALRSGYGSIFELFHVAILKLSLPHYALWLPALLCPALLVLPFAAFSAWRTHARQVAALASWSGSFLVFYAFYEVTPSEWWCLRFLLPAFPGIILLGLMGAEQFRTRFPGAPAIVALSVMAWTALAAPYFGRKLRVLVPTRNDQTYATTTNWMREHAPRDAAVLSMAASGALFYYTDFAILRWDCMTAADFRSYAATMQRTGRPVYALLFDIELAPAFQDHLPGHWEKVHTVKSATIWKWTAPE